MVLSTADKVKASLSILWVFFTILLSLAISSDSYEGFKPAFFILIAAILSTPILVYWLGYWIWGSGYLFKAISFPFVIALAFFKKSIVMAPTGAPAYVWPRYWARMIDILICSGLFWFICGKVAPEPTAKFITEIDKVNPHLSSIIALPFSVIINATIIAVMGNSIGKALLGLTLHTVDGKRIPLPILVQRELLILWRGLAMGIPIFTIFTMLKAHKDVLKGENTSWDKDLHTSVSAVHSFPLRTGIGTLIWISMIAGYTYLAEVKQEELAEANAARLQQIATEASIGTPKLIDEETRLDSVAAGQTSLIYRYTLVNYRSADVEPSKIREILLPSIKASSCTPEMKAQFLDYGVSLSFQYWSKDGIFITSITIDNSICSAN